MIFYRKELTGLPPSKKKQNWWPFKLRGARVPLEIPSTELLVAGVSLYIHVHPLKSQIRIHTETIRQQHHSNTQTWVSLTTRHVELLTQLKPLCFENGNLRLGAPLSNARKEVHTLEILESGRKRSRVRPLSSNHIQEMGISTRSNHVHPFSWEK